MNDDEIRRMVLDVLGEVAPEARLDRLAPEKTFQEQLDLDSMDFLNVVSGIAQRTGIEVPERDYPQIATLEGCVRYLAARASSPR